MKFRRQRSQEEVSINLTPLIDVVFLLLIFFMVSTTFTKETHLSIDLPQSTGDARLVQAEQIELIISKNGDFAINGEALVNAQLDTVKRALSKFSGGDTKMALIITADAQAAYQSVVTAMDAAGQMGFINLSMTTRRETESQP